ncbi:DMT family transporter [Denitromonas ohlonensis]|uniref:DMT family transporter n=2 Tax=Denitromonas TaxID=139331 RepID=A0A557SDS4_9RHOO|nr:DMT family transporter [Denitromonas ohlonensis]TVO64905.1 DMT family transporter [Denitromonas ohlonensis]TVO75578.1 DMT family transporter [Denitromonas ohlonensis]TVT78760.1 MAG: DMT family transporter [Denitromonas halophila]
MSAPPLTSIYIKLVLTTAFWGGTFIAGRYVAQQMPHFLAASGRFLIALIPLFLFTLTVGGGLTRLNKRQLIGTVLLGATGVFTYNTFFLGGLGHIPASRAALIVALSPIMTMFVMRFIAHERWTWLRVLGVLLSLSGVSMVITRGDYASVFSGAIGRGELYIFIAVASWVAYTVIGRYTLAGMSAASATTWSTLWGTLMLLVPASADLMSPTLAWPDGWSWVAMAYLGVFGTAVAFFWYNQAVAAIGPARATLFTNLVPVFAVVMSVVLLDERLVLASLVGGAMVITGVILANRPGAVLRPDSD